jgi:eight-cysteine-cluster-containing protein
MGNTNNIQGALKKFLFSIAVAAFAMTAFTFIPHSLSASSASETKPEDTGPPPKAPPAPAEKFCGWSSNGSCQSDMDCITSGCSGEVCQSANESVYNTICQSSDCYDAELYSLRCACQNNTCQWVN